MSAIPHVVQAEHVGEFRIRLTFDDGLVGVVDFRPWLAGAVFEPLKDLDYFRSFHIEGGTVAWPNGADVAPETLHKSARSGRAA